MDRKRNRQMGLRGIVLGAVLALGLGRAEAWGPYTHVTIGREVYLQAQQQGKIGDQFNASIFLAGCAAPDVFASLETSTAGLLDQLFGVRDAETETFQRWKAIGSNVFHGQGEAFARALWQQAGTDLELQTFALGWMTHVQSDLAMEESAQRENEGLNLNGTRILKALYDSVSAQGLSNVITPGPWSFPWLTEAFQGNDRYSQLVVQTYQAAGYTGLSADDLAQAARLHVETQKALWQEIWKTPKQDVREAMSQPLSQLIVALESIMNPKLSQITGMQSYEKYFRRAVERSLAAWGEELSPAGGCDVGFNYMHETWTDPWDNKPKLDKSPEQRERDFALMKKWGATAVRIHGANNKRVFKTVEEAHAAELRVWLSYRPNMRDLDIGQKDNQHPTHPRGLLDERYGYKREDLKEYLEPLREAFYKGFQDFVVAAEPLLRDGDCLVVANELPIDLGYEFDEYDQVYLRETFLLRELLLFARTALGEKKVELTYAALDPYELSESDWKELKEAGLDFASINRYWSKDDQGNAEGLAQVLAILHERCPNVPIAITECGALTCLQAQTFDGDGGQVNVGTLEEYRIGEEMQEMGIVELMGRIKDDPNTGRRYVASNGTNIPIRGVFLFAWDETMDTGFGLVRTNCMPVSWDQKGNPYVPQDGQTWQTGCLYRTGNYVPVGKRALQWVPVFFGSKQSPMEVVLRTDPATQAKVKGVEICWPSNFEPSKDLDPFIECKTGPYCTLLLYTLRQGSDEKGKVIWGKSGKTDEESESFWCADDARNYWVRAWWEDGSKGEWINLAPKTPDEQRTNKVTVTIKFGQ